MKLARRSTPRNPRDQAFPDEGGFVYHVLQNGLKMRAARCRKSLFYNVFSEASARRLRRNRKW